MSKPASPTINDINQCVEAARRLTRQLKRSRRPDRRLCRVFSSLAADEAVGLLAYVIWRGRAQLLSELRMSGQS